MAQSRLWVSTIQQTKGTSTLNLSAQSGRHRKILWVLRLQKESQIYSKIICKSSGHGHGDGQEWEGTQQNILELPFGMLSRVINIVEMFYVHLAGKTDEL